VKKRIAIVAGHFPPSNLAAVHRSRLWAQYLPEFGWEPTIVTTHWKYYEEVLDPALLELVSPELQVIRTKAIPVKPVRIIGDIGARALYWHLQALDELIVRDKIDFIHITIPSNFSALLGELLYRRHKVPFGIDYIDPWVHSWPAAKTPLTKAWISHKLSTVLEPWAVKNACLITGVAPLYYEPVLNRNPHLRHQCISAAMPYGNSEADYRTLNRSPRDTFLFRKDDGLFHMVYAGAMLPKAGTVLECLLEALAVLRDKTPEVIERLRVHFVGTGTSPDDPKGYNVQPRLQRFGLERWVDEHPNRVGYVDVLNHLAHASAILIVGSTEPHYTPSKVYQAVQAKRPMFALLHEKSTAVSVLRESRAGRAVTFTDDRLPAPSMLAETLAAFIRDPQYSAELVRWDAFEAYSARNSARILAGAVESALTLFQARRAGSTTAQAMQSATY
jgi:hypothetical protein